jgi:hypothetical protein
LTLPFISSENRKLCELCESEKEKENRAFFFVQNRKNTIYKI